MCNWRLDETDKSLSEREAENDGLQGLVAVMWSETDGLRTRPPGLRPKKIGLGLGLAGVMLCCETRSCHAHRHNYLEEDRNFSSTIYSFSFLCLEHHHCGDQQWRSLT